jgi:DNA-binding NarL/FixJ family response regulator
MEHKSLIIADDHPIFRHGVRHILSGLSWLQVAGEAETGTSALVQVRHLKPDLLLLDLEMPGMDGLSVLEEITASDLHTQVVILTSYDDEAYLEKTMELGGRAYVLKDEAGQTLVSCLETVRDGGIYISPSLGGQTRLPPAGKDGNQERLMLLTQMERTVLEAVAQFKTSKEIARDLDISYRTVQCHRNNICSKLGLKGANQLLQFAKETF